MIRVFYIILSFSICIQNLNAQNKTDNYFNQLNIGIGYLPILTFSPTSIEYSPTNMFRVSLGANYGKGFFKGKMQYGKMISQNTMLPDCQVFNFNLAYEYYVPIFKFLDAYAGIETGLHNIKFDDPDVPFYSSNETEMVAGVEFGIAAKLSPKVSATCSYRIQRIFSTPRVDISFGDIGLIYYFNKSKKVQEWLQ